MVPSPYIRDSETTILISALKRVQENDGYVDGIDLWFEDKFDTCQPNPTEKCETCELKNPHWYPSDRRECRKATKRLEVLDDTLYMLRNIVAKRLTCIRQRDAQFALRDAIRNIPPEILGLIFRFAHSSGRNDYRVTETLSLVCTRFRDTCLQIPQMWSTLHSFDSLDKNRLNLNRSSTTTLEITIHHSYHGQLESGSQETAQFLELVTPYASRWVSLDIYTEDSCLPGMFANLPILQLPKLVSIQHAEDIDCAYPGDGHFFYSKWNMPSLTSFEGANVIPNRMSIRSNITKCKLYWKSVLPWPGQGVQCIILGDLTRSLHSLQTLSQLELDFDVINMTVTTSTPMAVLPNLKSLTLRFGRYMPSDALYELISSFSTPNLDTLHLTICNDEIARSCTEMFSRLMATDLFRNLKSLFLETHDRNDWCLFLKALLCQSPSLLNLTLHAPSAAFAQDAGLCASGKLQTVRFENCDRLSEPQMKAIYKCLLGPSIDKVEVMQCKSLNQTFLSKWEVVLEEDGVELVWRV